MEALPVWLREPLAGCADRVENIRLRAEMPARFEYHGGGERSAGPLRTGELQHVAAALMDYSLYAWEDELRQGFFTLEGGCRVGVAGRCALEGNRIRRIEDIQALCVRVARPVPGCADALLSHALRNGRPRSLLVVSPPGLGKTTLLRDLARQLSNRGINVSIADERSELAALQSGEPALDVGPCTDVIDQAPRYAAIPYLIRTMAPEVIVTDELGDMRDVEAVLDAKRCGVAMIASAHGDSIEAALHRPALRQMADAFDCAVLLAEAPGKIACVRALEGV